MILQWSVQYAYFVLKKLETIEFLESFDENKVQTNIQTCICNYVNVFRFTYDQFNASLLDKGNFLPKMNTSNLWGFTFKLLNSSVNTVMWFKLTEVTRCVRVYDLKVPRKRFESIRIHLLSYRSSGTLMSYTDHSAQRRFKSNTPITE